MRRETLQKLVLSKNIEDRFIAIEHLTKMTQEAILDILECKKTGSRWYKHAKQMQVPTKGEGGAYKANGGYIAHNGYIWYTTVDADDLRQKGYNI